MPTPLTEDGHSKFWGIAQALCAGTRAFASRYSMERPTAPPRARMPGIECFPLGGCRVGRPLGRESDPVDAISAGLDHAPLTVFVSFLAQAAQITDEVNGVAVLDRGEHSLGEAHFGPYARDYQYSPTGGLDLGPDVRPRVGRRARSIGSWSGKTSLIRRMIGSSSRPPFAPTVVKKLGRRLPWRPSRGMSHY